MKLTHPNIMLASLTQQDFSVTMVALVTMGLEGSFNMGLFRLFRLLQLLRTFSKIQQLRIIIESLARAIGPMKYIFTLWATFNYLAAIGGMLFFSKSGKCLSFSLYRIYQNTFP
jgi:hypothetical protein